MILPRQVLITSLAFTAVAATLGSCAAGPAFGVGTLAAGGLAALNFRLLESSVATRIAWMIHGRRPGFLRTLSGALRLLATAGLVVWLLTRFPAGSVILGLSSPVAAILLHAVRAAFLLKPQSATEP